MGLTRMKSKHWKPTFFCRLQRNLCPWLFKFHRLQGFFDQGYLSLKVNKGGWSFSQTLPWHWDSRCLPSFYRILWLQKHVQRSQDHISSKDSWLNYIFWVSVRVRYGNTLKSYQMGTKGDEWLYLPCYKWLVPYLEQIIWEQIYVCLFFCLYKKYYMLSLLPD